MKTIDMNKKEALPKLYTGKRGRPPIDWYEFVSTCRAQGFKVTNNNAEMARKTAARITKSLKSRKPFVKATVTVDGEIVMVVKK